MTEDTLGLNKVITIDNERIKSHLDRVVRGSVVETLTRCWMPRRIVIQPHPASVQDRDGGGTANHRPIGAACELSSKAVQRAISLITLMVQAAILP